MIFEIELKKDFFITVEEIHVHTTYDVILEDEISATVNRERITELQEEWEEKYDAYYLIPPSNEELNDKLPSACFEVVLYSDGNDEKAAYADLNLMWFDDFPMETPLPEYIKSIINTLDWNEVSTDYFF